MGVNNAEDSLAQGLANELKGLRQEFDAYRNTPQRIGNGSINYGLFSLVEYGPVTLAAGSSHMFAVQFASEGGAFNYDGKPAINRITLFDLLFTLYVDAHDDDHIYYYGSSLSSGQRRVYYQYHMDLRTSGISEQSGQRTLLMQIVNSDAVSHDYYVDIRGVIPRPALKPQ